MDSYNQPHRYIGAPAPPSTADPYHQQPRPPLPPNGPFFPGQFQYPPPSHSPSPSTSQWLPSSLPPPPPPPGSYAPPPYSYPLPIIHHAQFPPRPHVVPHLPPHYQVPQSYCQGNQEWSSSNWTPHQSWDYVANKGEEDWAAKARAWADAKNAMENQHSQPQFAPVGRVEEKTQYPQAVYSHFQDYEHQPPPPPPLNYENFSGPRHPVLQPAITHCQDPATVSSESSYAPDGHQPHMGYDRSLGGDASASLHHQKSLSTGPTVHQQEVPSSYSSVAGKDDTADHNEGSFKMLASHNSSVKEGEPPLHQGMPTSYSFGNQSTVPSSNLADQPLDFTPRFGHDHDMSSTYYHNSVGHAGNIESVPSISSLNYWPPPPPGMVYPSISPVLSSGSQHDPSIVFPSVSGNTAPSFGRIAGPGLPSAAPLGASPFDLSAGTVLPPVVFSNDTYGIANMSDRPKKAAVPNWLKEEIKKAVSTSTAELPKERTQFMEDEGFDKSSTKDDQTDTKSVDSFRSTEEGDEDDEDSIEVARNAAINHEIKRLLTEVLLKVTDALFDEIATKVIDEDDFSVEVSQSALSSNQILSPAPQQAPTSKAFAKVLVPSKAKEPYGDSNSEKSNSSFQGDVLGLADYASDEEVPLSNAQNTVDDSAIQQSNGKWNLDHRHLETGNGKSLVDRDDKGSSQMNFESDATKSISTIYDKDNSLAFSELNSNDVDKERGQQYSLMPAVKDGCNGGIDVLQKVSGETEFRLPRGNNVIHEQSPKRSQGKEVTMKVDKNGRVENAIISSGKDHFSETETTKKRKDEKGNESCKRQDEKHLEREVTGDSKDRKEKDVETGKKDKESESRKKHGIYEAKDDRKDSDRLHKSSARDGNDSKRESAKGKEEDRARHNNSSETSKHKSKYSSSNSSKARSSNENKFSSDGSDHSKRKPHSRKRSSSPSPDRSKRRQVSRSPHSKHSQRRHSPYSSFDGARGRRSRSRSPVRRQR